MEDGTAEAWVHCKDKQVADLLQLSSTEWEGLQQHVGQRGNVFFLYQGRSGHELVSCLSFYQWCFIVVYTQVE